MSRRHATTTTSMTALTALTASTQKGSEYSRIFVGDAEFTDDPNDDWLCISFNRVYVGDFTPCNVYIHRITGKVRTQESSVFCRLMQGLRVCRMMTTRLSKFEFCRHHRIILERFARQAFANAETEEGHRIDSRHATKKLSLETVMISMTQQRV